MLGVCESCANELIEENVVKCGGFCTAQFCLQCSKIDSTICAKVSSITNLFWMCNACSNMMEKARFRNAMVSTNAAVSQNFDELKNEIRCSVLEEIRLEIRTNFKQLIDAVPKTPAPVPNVAFFGSSKRKRENDGKIEPTPKRLSQLRRGTDSSGQPASVGTTSESNMFWLYLSDISAGTPDECVTELVHQRLGSRDLKIVKLVAKGKDLRYFNFVSFKVGMPMQLKQKAMQESTWPSEISFREFEERGTSRKVFWKPPVVVRSEEATSISNITSNAETSTTMDHYSTPQTALP